MGVSGSLDHLLWRLSDENKSLKPFIGEDSYERLMVHLGETLTAARQELDAMARVADFARNALQADRENRRLTVREIEAGFQALEKVEGV
jgi:hypothetical protein